jgi:hypothetical protein
MDGQSCREEGGCAQDRGCAQNGESDSTRITEYPYGVLRQADNRGGWLSIKLLWHNVVICEGWVAGVFCAGSGSDGRMDRGASVYRAASVPDA